MSEQNATHSAPTGSSAGKAGKTGSTTGGGTSFNGGSMWIGEHSADGDLLVFDPAIQSNSAECVAFFSLGQLRTRVFPRAVVDRQITEVTDSVRKAKAKKDYGRRAQLLVVHEAERATERAAVSDRLRDQVIQRHERYLAAHNIAYQGVLPTPPDRKPRKRVKCHACGIALDDFTGSICGVCTDVLCSCGACACASRPVKAT